MEKRKSQQGVGLRIGHVWVSSGWTWCASIGWQCLEAAGECTYMSPWRAVRLRWWGEKWILALYSRNSVQCNSQWQQQRAATAVGWNSPPIVSYGKPFPVVWGRGLPDKPTVAISRCWGKDGWSWFAQLVTDSSSSCRSKCHARHKEPLLPSKKSNSYIYCVPTLS
jgi:hypothetical protein